MKTLTSIATSHYAVEYVDFALTDLPDHATLVFAGESTEDRGQHPAWGAALTARASDCVEVLPQSGTTNDPYLLHTRTSRGLNKCSLRDDNAILAALGNPDAIALDVSGLNHAVWASILRAVVRTRNMPTLTAIYVEPARYRSHASPATIGSFDLSVGFDGIRPIPGFARLSQRTRSKRRVFVPLLGFEGSRPRLVHTELDATMVAPIVGLPGFRIEFPAVAVACNQPYLDDVRGYDNLRFARGACPFDAFDVISAIADDMDADHLQLAPLGTKPHAIGAFLFALRRPELAEIVYDHPVRRPSRTEGIGLTHVYDMSAFVRSW